MHDCSQFGLGTRSLQICLGESELPLRKVNAFRALHGIDPFADDKTSADITGETSQVRASMSPNRPGQRSGGCCGKKTATPAVVVRHAVIGTGVGGRLIEMFKAHGFEACEACYELAHRMNEWGPEGCRTNLEMIVADILPRALIWERDKVGWWAKLLPESVTEAAIKLMVEQAIATAKPLEWVAEPKPVVNRAVRHDPRKFVTRVTDSNWQPLIGVPIDRSKLVTHMLYHFMPLNDQSEAVWRRHADWIREVRGDFNGRLLVGITSKGQEKPGHVLMPPDTVMDALQGLDAEFIVEPNHPQIGEGQTFPKMLAAIQTQNPNEVFFYGHSKGVTRPTDETPQLWAKASFDTLFRNRVEAISALDSVGVVGAFRMPGGKAVNLPGLGPWWFFSGTFFAVRSVDAFKRNWSSLPKHYGCVEQWPRLNFDRLTETRCLFHDETANLYDANYWRETVTPAFEKWKVDHARLSVR